MRRVTSWYLAIAVVGLARAASAQAATRWHPAAHPFSESSLSLIEVDPANPAVFYAGSASTVYASQDAGATWQRLFSAPGHARVNDVAIDPFDARHLLVATERGLYDSIDAGRHWRRMLRGPAARSIAPHPATRHTLFLGTAGGLLFTEDGGSSWESLGSTIGRREIREALVDPQHADRLYLLTDQGLFAGSITTDAWTLLLRTSQPDLPEETVEDPIEEPAEDETASWRLTSLAIDPQQPDTLYIGSSRGLLISRDAGATWTRPSAAGFGQVEIRRLIVRAHSPTIVYAATAEGIARYLPQEDRWQWLNEGLRDRSAHALASTSSHLLAATDGGLYLLDLTEELAAPSTPPSAQELLANFVHEPTIGQVQREAMRYAEVEPDKIQRWRRQAAMKALLPTFSVDYDRDQDTYIASSVTTTGTRVFETEDPSSSWGFSIDWELGDLIWNDDQTSIDTRSRLLVQLRDDVLDEATRSYFERRRLQLALLTSPPADPASQIEQELRLAELTAILDGLTGGWFSEQLETNGDR